MPLTPSNGDHVHGRFTRLYRRLDTALWRHLAAFLLSGRGNAGGWRSRMLMRRPQFRVGVERLVADAARVSPDVAASIVERAWRDGASMARADTRSRRDVYEPAAVRLILDRVAAAVAAMHTHIPQHADRVYRETIADVGRGPDLDEPGRVRRVARFLSRQARAGFVGLVDRHGRRRELVTYAEQTIRGAVSAAEVDGYCRQAVADGFDLFIVSDVAGSCALCSPFEGRLISITGRTVGAISRNTVDGVAVRVDVVCSLAEALQRGLFHYGCRHTIKVWSPDDPAPPRAVRATPAVVAQRRRAAADARRERQVERVAIVAQVASNGGVPPDGSHPQRRLSSVPPPTPPSPPTGGGGDDGGDDFYRVPVANIVHNLGRLSQPERDAVEGYALSPELINATLRGQQAPSPLVESLIERIRSALHRQTVPETVRVSRELDGDILGITGEASARRLIGTEFVELGFMSTSMAANPPRNLARRNPVILDLIVPAGTHALAIGELAEFPAERELLVIDARRISIVGVSYDDRKRMWRLRGYVVG